jgi:hypothetical protein
MSLLLLFSSSGEAAQESPEEQAATPSPISSSSYSPVISVSVHSPLAAGGNLEFASLEVNSYSHSIQAVGGYDTASFTIAANRTIVNDWLINGPMRHIIVKEGAGQVVWEGFVNRVDLTFGRVSISRGPILDSVNKVACKYTTVRYDPLGINFGGKPAITPYEEDSDMQAIYGIIEGVVSGGEMHEDDAAEIARTHLAEFKYPQTTHNVTFLGGNDPSIVVHCLGYSHLFDKYTYSKIDSASDINLSTKIQRVVEGDPNSYFTVSGTAFATNTLQINEYEDGEKVARGVIDDLVARGDDEDNRYLWGVYNNRVFSYVSAPTNTERKYEMSEAQGIILDQDGNRVPPWRVTPGGWVTLSELTLGSQLIGTQDPGASATSIFMESVNFTAPYTLDISGGRVSTLRQKLYRLGLGGKY